MICYKITLKEKGRELDVTILGVGYVVFEGDFMPTATPEIRDMHRQSVAEFLRVESDEIEAISEEQYELEMSMLDDLDIPKISLDMGDEDEVDLRERGIPIRTKPSGRRTLN